MNVPENGLFGDANLLQAVLPRLNRFLSVRERAESEVREYITRKQLCSEESSAAVLAFLRQEGILDDSRFAENRIAYRRERGYGPRYIRNEMRRFRIDAATVSSHLDSVAETLFDRAALQVLEKKLPALITKASCEERLRALLGSRGFTGAQIDRSVQMLQNKYPHWARRSTL